MMGGEMKDNRPSTGTRFHDLFSASQRRCAPAGLKGLMLLAIVGIGHWGVVPEAKADEPRSPFVHMPRVGEVVDRLRAATLQVRNTDGIRDLLSNPKRSLMIAQKITAEGLETTKF